MFWYLKGSQSVAGTRMVQVASEGGLPVIRGMELSFV
jgi:hypothetical protein